MQMRLQKGMKSFFQGGFLLKKLNHTNIVLIPKVPHPESLSQFRPISLCNFSVKIISKVLANRLKKFLNGIITPYQSAFVPGRQIQDNILVAHEAFHFLKRKRRGKESFAAIKLDLSKAYDRVQWDFLEVVMRKIGFCDMFIHWVMQIVSTVSYTARNDLVFQSLKQSPVSIVARAMGAWDEFISATETISSTHQSHHSSPPLPSFHWIPPGAGSMKINCDASWSKDLKRGWGGIILRDDRGHLVDGRRFRISASSAFLAEASVLREACLFAKALNLSSVCIENDNVQLISLSVSELVPPWQALAIISDIRLFANELRLSFCWTPREGNEAAHWIASSKASSLGLDWVVSPPAVLFSILCNDALVYQ
ncbi:hypothetical protein RHSIM_Rhsim01G0155500 [Rhododendron simsii]|uniref:Reverse transcriptase n=1 Tax=Rhododendron simsii TaxID=118357 RepID=A0A834M027_RHOSS|nr:hypothetical protein RHSIM_Rhsim01G0155500 [Rhododendron simsii]